MPILSTRSAFSARGYGFGASSTQAVYIEDVFSTYLYTGNGSTLTVTNNIDLSTKGGMIWSRNRGADNGWLYSTPLGTGSTGLISNDTASISTYAIYNNITSFNTDGVTFGTSSGGNSSNSNGASYGSWTFRKQAKFFDVVTYTGTGSARTIAHNLGATPGMIIVKRTDATSNWRVYHSGLTSASYYLGLNQTIPQTSGTTIWNATAPTSSVFSVGTDATVNASGGTYIAYLFASNAGGFGSAGTDNVITCGTYTGNGSTTGPIITLGYEPQFVIIKDISWTGSWGMYDNMRGVATGGPDAVVFANLNSAEFELNNIIQFNATGFSLTSTDANTNTSGYNYVYMAIRRGPMKTPTSGTSVYSPITSSAAAGTAQTTNFVVDTQIAAKQSGADSLRSTFNDRLRGISTTATASGNYLISSSTAAEATSSATTRYWNNTGFQNPTYYGGTSSIYWSFGRAPGFFDVVCYTGNGSASTKLNHNLTVVPELLITKCRNSSTDGNSSWSAGWWVATGNPSYAYLFGPSSSSGLNSSGAGISGGAGYFVSPDFTSSVYNPWLVTASSGSEGRAGNVSGKTYVTYLFATCPGVSKVGTYTGTGAAQNINCGFAAGARFVLIKRYDSTGDWYVYDSARGINASGTNDPYLLFNSTAAEVTTTDYLATYSSGFALTSSGSTTTNVSGGTYIYLAIA